MLTIIEIHGEDENGSADYEIKIEREGKHLDGFVVYALCECPEDAILTRNLSFAYKAIDFFKLGYEAGKKNEEVKYIEEKEEN